MKTCQGRCNLWALSLFFLSSLVNASCFEVEWKRGKPFDYYATETWADTGTYRGGLIHLVERRHFTYEVKTLAKGSTSFQPGDLVFVLNTIPNHPGALDAYSRYEKRYRDSKLFSGRMDTRKPPYIASCLFERANSVFPDNSETLATWGLHEYRNERLDTAREKLEQAVALNPDNIVAQYNLGLVYTELNELQLAKKQAEIAYQAGYPLPGLRNKIAQLENTEEN